MNNKKFRSSVFSLSTSVLLFSSLIASQAYAQTTSLGLSASTSVAGSVSGGASTSVGVTVQARQAARLAKIIARSDTAISDRITSLNALNARIQGLINVSAAQKASISTTVQTNSAGLTTLKSKIDADTDASVAATDEKAIYGSFRIYALVLPQGYIEASADRVNTIVGMMTTISAKLQARISAYQTAGKNVTTLQASLTDLNAKIADATIQANLAQSTVVSLTPDQGNQTQLQSNTAALKTARATIKIATQDLQAARQDAKIISQGLKILNASATTTTSVSATTTSSTAQ